MSVSSPRSLFLSRQDDVTRCDVITSTWNKLYLSRQNDVTICDVITSTWKQVKVKLELLETSEICQCPTLSSGG